MDRIKAIQERQEQLENLINNYIDADGTVAQVMLPIQIELAGSVPFLLTELKKTEVERDEMANACHDSEIKNGKLEAERERLVALVPLVKNLVAFWERNGEISEHPTNYKRLEEFQEALAALEKEGK